MLVRSFAKINWMLRVLGRREDGYHDLETIFQSISLHDDLLIEESDAPAFSTDDRSLPLDDRNLAVRAAQVMVDEFRVNPVTIRLTKRIPVGGGLGGGSSNAAAVLLAVNKLYSLDISSRRLRAIALSLGSDVPFFLEAGTAHASGRGEVLTALPFVGRIPLLLVIPEAPVSTAAAFTQLDLLRNRAGVPETVAAAGVSWLSSLERLPAGDSSLTNDLEAAAFSLMPPLKLLFDRLQTQGAGWCHMTGSGSTLVAAFASTEERDAARDSFGDVRTAIAETISREQALE
ncbi:MAG TPA: 4-(cytidine 5'-diphospho)-2-C-methyl-D-erythritol kinase [Thermoanaerobaculia bacterium]|nr:4-(cytidine 5'-diphospho)-2-C-methyl-D-erythritol kinase [Thermoanaerobaculia bacterium]